MFPSVNFDQIDVPDMSYDSFVATSTALNLQSDIAPSLNARQFAITSITNPPLDCRTTHNGDPFTVTGVKPANYRFKVYGKDGVLKAVPKNTYKLITRKGVKVESGPEPKTEVAVITTTIDVPSGSEVSDPNNLVMAIASHIGALSSERLEIIKSVIVGV